MSLAPSVASLEAVAMWNVDKALYLMRRATRENNHDRSEAYLSDAGRHFRNADACRRQAFLMERRKQKKEKH